jgi:cell division protein FtsW (lipid II flippase)
VTEPDHGARLAVLANAHWALAGLVFIAAAVPAFYASLGLDLVFNATAPLTSRAETGWRILVTGLAWVLLAFAYVLLLITSARALRLRRRYRLVVVTNLLSCLFVPFGTVLGLTTLVVLRDPEVRQQFGRALAHRGPRG